MDVCDAGINRTSPAYIIQSGDKQSGGYGKAVLLCGYGEWSKAETAAAIAAIEVIEAAETTW